MHTTRYAYHGAYHGAYRGAYHGAYHEVALAEGALLVPSTELYYS